MLLLGGRMCNCCSLMHEYTTLTEFNRKLQVVSFSYSWSTAYLILDQKLHTDLCDHWKYESCFPFSIKTICSESVHMYELECVSSVFPCCSSEINSSDQRHPSHPFPDPSGSGFLSTSSCSSSGSLRCSRASWDPSVSWSCPGVSLKLDMHKTSDLAGE